MAKLTEQDFKKEISSRQFKRIYLIYGDEKYLVKKYTDTLINKALGKNPSDFDLIRLRSDASPEMIFSAARQISMFSDIKCVLVSDYDTDGLSESDYRALETLMSDIPEGTILIFSMPTLSKESKKTNAKSSREKKFSDTAAKYGTVLKLDKKGDIALETQLVSWAEKNGCLLTRINAAKIIALCGTDMTSLKNEIDKLSAYANYHEEITEDMIRQLVVKNTEVRVFALSDCISKNDFNGAYHQLHRLFEQNEKAEIILSVLSSVFVDMYRMKAASESGKSISDAAADFKYGKREFVLKNAYHHSKRYSTQTLRKILDVILETDIKLKSTRTDHEVLLETLIAKLLITVREGQ